MTPARARIISFDTPVETSESAPAPEQLLSGQPKHVLANHYDEPTQQFFSGTWASTRGKWRVNYTEHEFCHMLEGRVVIVGESGERSEFAAGDSFVIPAGFRGTWEVVEDCRKLYAIFQSAAAAS